ncbi:hypothetical protein C3L33_19254, partial [Rhododendron williamsianum]
AGRNRLPGQKDEYQKYTPLLKAALRGDWEAAKKFFAQDPKVITAPITRELESALYMATGTGPAAIDFVAELLKLMPAEALAQGDIAGNTPLHLSAWVGNTAAAVLLLEKNPGLLRIREERGWLPVHFAAIHAKKETLWYLLKVTFKDDAAMRTLFFSPGPEPSGTDLLIHVITSGFYGEEILETPALHSGSWVGNTAATVLLEKKNPGLLRIRGERGWLPVHFAAIRAKKETLSYLLKVTFKDDAAMRTLFFSPGSGPSGTELLIHVLTSGFYGENSLIVYHTADLALDLVKRLHPRWLDLAQTYHDNDSGLRAIARNVQAFPSGTHLNFWERIIYARKSMDMSSDISAAGKKLYGEAWSDQAAEYWKQAIALLQANQTVAKAAKDLKCVVMAADSSVFDRQIMTDTTELRRRKEAGMKRLSGKKDKYQKYAPLLKAALKGDWETAKKFFDQDPDAITAPITRELETALYMATGSGPAAINFVAELLKLMPAEALAQRDIAGHNPLHLGACVGNKAATVLLLEKNPGLLSMREGRGWLPVHFAAIHAKKKTLSYLLKVTFEDDEAMRTLFVSPDGSTEPSGTDLLIDVITSGFYADLALDLVHRHPQLATSLTPKDNDSGLGAIARKLENYAEDPSGVEIENPVNNKQLPVQKYQWARFIGKAFPMTAVNSFLLNTVIQKSQAVLWKVFALLVPQVKRIREQKQMHQHALQLVRYLVKEIVILNDLSMYDSLETKVVVNAARLGIHEVVEEIVESIPKLAWARDSECRSIYQRAVMERHENVFNLIYQMSDHKHTVSMSIDESGNNILHIAGQLAPLYKLNLVSGAALQMQRELQWFKAITAPITRELESALYLATGVGPKAIPFVTKLLERMPAEALAHRDEAGNTPLHLSALVDNTAAAKLLVGKNRELLCMRLQVKMMRLSLCFSSPPNMINRPECSLDNNVEQNQVQCRAAERNHCDDAENSLVQKSFAENNHCKMAELCLVQMEKT